MATIDFHKSGIFHLLWKRKIRAFIDGKTDIEEHNAGSARKCDLGKWLYTEGIKKYGDHPEVLDLEKLHMQIHSLSQKAIDCKKNRQLEKADAEYALLDDLSKQMINLLTILGTIVQ